MALGVFVPVACMVIVAEGTAVLVGTWVAGGVTVEVGVIVAVGEGPGVFVKVGEAFGSTVGVKVGVGVATPGRADLGGSDMGG